MCHNVAMKKSRMLLLPLVLLLAGCNNQLEVGFKEGDTHSAGPDRETSSKEGGVISYSYMNNTSLDNTGLTKASLTFANINASKTDIQDKELLMSYLSVENGILTGVDNPHYVSTKDDGTFFIGADSSYVDGMITLYFNVNIKNIEITAKPYYSISTAFNEETLTYDHEVCMAVNNTGYIKLNENVNEETKEVPSTTLSYHLQEAAGAVTIKVGKRRAIFEKIDLYY